MRHELHVQLDTLKTFISLPASLREAQHSIANMKHLPEVLLWHYLYVAWSNIGTNQPCGLPRHVC